MCKVFIKQRNKFLIILIIMYPFLFIWQGGDLTDTGFVTIGYQFFFENLDLGQLNSFIFLSDFIGASLLKLFPKGGVIGLSLMGLFVIYIMNFISYNLLKTVTKNKSIILVGLLCGTAFLTRNIYFSLSYDLISFLFLLIMTWFLLKGLKNGKKFIFVSGMSLFIASISRFPNVVFLLFLPIVLSYYKLYKPSKNNNLTVNLKWVFYNCALFFFGFSFAFILFWVILKHNLVWEVFVDDISSDKTGYSILNLLKSYLKDALYFMPYLLSVLVLICFISKGYDYFKRRGVNNVLIVLIISLFLLPFAFFSFNSFSTDSSIKYLIPAIIIFPLLFSILKKDKFSFVVVLIIACALSQIAGTNTGVFLKSSFGCLLLIPLSFLILNEYKSLGLFNSVFINTWPVYWVSFIYILLLSLFIRIGYIFGVDGGLLCRFRSIHTVKHEKMHGIYTTKNNASHIEALSSSIKNEINENNTLFIYGHQPLFYYLTNQKPSIQRFWLANKVITAEELFVLLEKEVSENRKFPLIVDTKQNILGNEGQILLQKFLIKYNYHKIKESDTFMIWQTKLLAQN